MATTWITATDLLDAALPPVCIESGLPSDAVVEHDVVMLSNEEPTVRRSRMLTTRFVVNALVGGNWLERADRWASWSLPHSWDAREQRESRALAWLGALLPTSALLFWGVASGDPAATWGGLALTLLVVVCWSMLRAPQLRVLGFDGTRYLVAGVHPKFVRALRAAARPRRVRHIGLAR